MIKMIKKEYIMAGMTVILWSTLPSVSKLIINELSPMSATFYASLIAAVTLLVINLIRGGAGFYKVYKLHDYARKNIMRNAIKMANRVLDSLPVDEAPESTEGREGFFHPLAISGSVAKASLSIIVRDHDAKAFDARKAFLSTLASRLNKEFGDGSVQLELHDQYRNMEEALQAAPFLKEAALSAIRSVGLQPVVKPIRGGTDGAILSQRGIPCPNLGNGGHLFHSLCEFVCLQEMEQALSIVLQIAQNWHCRFSR